MPKGLKDGARILKPLSVHGELKFVSGAFLNDLAIPGMGRIGFAADLFDQFQPRQSQLLQVKDFERLVVKTVDPVFFARAILDLGE